MAEGQGEVGRDLVVGGAHGDVSTLFGNASRCVDTDHAVADYLEIGHFSTAGEFNLCGAKKTRAADGHRLVGDNLRREERLDA